jgi:hypothetical protein
MMIFIKLIYDDLRNSKGKIILQPYSLGTRFKWIGAGALGYIVLPVILFVIMGTTLPAPLLALKGMLSNSETQLKRREKIRSVPIEIEPGVHHQVGAEESSSQEKPEPPSFPEGKKPGATGEALIIRDGPRETFVLQTDK